MFSLRFRCLLRHYAAAIVDYVIFDAAFISLRHYFADVAAMPPMATLSPYYATPYALPIFFRCC